MILAKGDPTWWGEIEGWLAMNGLPVKVIGLALGVLIVYFLARPPRRRRGR